MKTLLMLFVFAVPVAFVLVPLQFELAASLLFVALFLLVILHDFVHASHMQHGVPRQPRLSKGLKEWLHLRS